MRFGVIGSAFDAIEFDGAGDVNFCGGHAEHLQALSAGVGLCGRERDGFEHGFEESADFEVAVEAAFAESGVDDGDGNLAVAAFQQEAGPEFEFHEDENFGADGQDGTSDGPGEVEWEPDDLAVGEALLCEIEAGIGGGGDDDEVVVCGLALEVIDNFLELDDFADADGMEPCDGSSVVIDGDISEQFCCESSAVASVAQHSPEDDGGECSEECGVDQIKEPAHRRHP